MDMSSNSLTTYGLYAIYASEGLAICFGNGLLLLTIVMEKSLRKRKEMRIVAGLCAVDFSYGLGTLLTNVIRVILIIAGLQSTATTAWRCMLQPQIFMNNIGAQMTAIMNVVLSVDRFVAVANPMYYRGLGTNYATKIFGIVLIFFFLSSFAMYATTYFNVAISTFTLMCVGTTFPRYYALFEYTLITGAGALSILIYICVFFAYKSQMKRNSNAALNDQKARVQRRLTVTLGMITISTLIFYIIPFGVLTYFLWIIADAPTVPLAIATRMSAILNIVIYVYRQKEVRPGMWRILRFKRCCKRSTAVEDVSSVNFNRLYHR